MWNQLISPNTDITYTGGWCLKGVQDAFNTDHPYATALDAWRGVGDQHTDFPPDGVAVPVYFRLIGKATGVEELAGHVAIRLADGRVASTSVAGVHQGLYIHPDLNGLISFYSSAWKVITLGWKEYVGTKKVIEWEDPMVKITKEQLIWNYRLIGGYEPSDDEVKYWMDRTDKGASYSDVTEEMKNYFQTRNQGYYQYKEATDKQIADLKKQVGSGSNDDDGAAAKLQAIKDALK